MIFTRPRLTPLSTPYSKGIIARVSVLVLVCLSSAYVCVCLRFELVNVSACSGTGEVLFDRLLM